MTRATSSETVEPVENPEDLLKKPKKKLTFKDDMEDLSGLSLDEYTMRTKEGAPTGLIRPPISATTNFEIKGQFLHLLSQKQFSGKEYEDPYNHIDDILEITDYFNIPGVTKDAVMLRVFPITLIGAAKIWLKREPARITTWDALKDKFIKRFSPPAKISKLKKKITNFEQDDDESLYDAWDRYKGLLENCPQHDLNEHQIVQIFYDGTNYRTRQLIDAQGPITRKPPAEGYRIIEELAEHTHHWHSSRDMSRKGSGETSEGFAALNAKLEAMSREMKKVNQTIHAIQVGCDNCSGSHLTKDCDLDEDGNKKAQVCYTTGNQGEWKPRNNNWKPFDEYKRDREMQGRWRQQEPGLYQRPPQEDPQQGKTSNLEEMMAKFITESGARHKRTEEMVERLDQKTDLMIRNQQASILNLEKQIGQIARTVQERGSGTLPSNTEPNPKAHVNAITTRMGRIFEHVSAVEAPEPSARPDQKEENKVASVQKTQRVSDKNATRSVEIPVCEPKIEPYRPPIPFPQRLVQKPEKKELIQETLFESPIWKTTERVWHKSSEKEEKIREIHTLKRQPGWYTPDFRERERPEHIMKMKQAEAIMEREDRMMKANMAEEEIKEEEENKELLKQLNSLQIKVPLIEAVTHMPAYADFFDKIVDCANEPDMIYKSLDNS